MKKVTTTSDDYLVYFHPLKIVSNVFEEWNQLINVHW